MNLSQLRKLVEQTRDLPDNTVLVVTGDSHPHTYEEVRSIQPVQVLAFQRPRSQCPLGTVLHAKDTPEAFGYRSQAELDEHALVETVLHIV